MFDKTHPSFELQPEADAMVWRYMDLARYLSLLESQALHFARADQMVDKWEGAYGAANLNARPSMYGEDFATMKDAFPAIRKFGRERIYLNCWHMADVESAAMWDIYQREGRGVAIRSTWGALTTSITSDRSVYGAEVKYVDYTSTVIPEGIIFDAYLHKRESFSHEREVRLVMMGEISPLRAADTSPLEIKPSEDPVISVSVDLRSLISAIFVAPDAPAWIAELVEKVTGRYEFDFEVRQSDLASDPVA